MLYKKWNLFAITFLLTTYSISLSAGSLGDAFNGLLAGTSVSTSAPGNFKANARRIVTFGGTRVRFPQSSVQLLSVTPPNISAGCNGIDAYMGGFSYIDSDAFVDALKQMGTATLGAFLNLAIRTSCPICAAVMDIMRTASEVGRSMAFDSCSVGTKLAGKLYDNGIFQSKGELQSASGANCSKDAANFNKVDSFLDAANSVCGSLAKARDFLNSDWAGLDEETKEKKLQLSPEIANPTWLALKEGGFFKGENNDYAIGELFMSMIGASVNLGKDVFPASLPPEKALEIFMCGMNKDPGSSMKYCRDGVDLSKTTILTCQNTSDLIQDAYTECKNIRQVKVGDWELGNKYFGSQGFLQYVESTLKGAVETVQNNQESTVDGFKWENFVSLVNATPLPIYRMVNLAAIYPGLADSMNKSFSTFIAHHLAQSYFRHLFLVARKVRGEVKMDPKVYSAVMKIMNKVDAQVDISGERLDNMLVRQQMFVDRLNQFQKIMQDQIHTGGFGTGLAFSNSVVTRIAAATGEGPAGGTSGGNQ